MPRSAGKWTLKLDTKLTDEVRSAAVAGISHGALGILREANKHVPTEEGDLQRSGTVDVDAHKLQATIGYGAGAAHGYTIRQHEDLTLTHDAGRTAKWLERAMHQHAREALDDVAASIRRVTR